MTAARIGMRGMHDDVSRRARAASARPGQKRDEIEAKGVAFTTADIPF